MLKCFFTYAFGGGVFVPCHVSITAIPGEIWNGGYGSRVAFIADVFARRRRQITTVVGTRHVTMCHSWRIAHSCQVLGYKLSHVVFRNVS